MYVLITRPEPDATELARSLESAGHNVLVSPLLHVTYDRPDISAHLQTAAALIATSRHALHSLAREQACDALITLPIYCVGAATADVARDIGFTNVTHGEGNATDLGRLIQTSRSPDCGPLLRLTGTRPSSPPDRLSPMLRAAGFTVKDIPCYRVETAPEFTSEARSALAAGILDAAILMSPLTARTFVIAAKSANLTQQSEKLRYFCLSKAVADALTGIPESNKVVAEQPKRSNLIRLVDHAVA